MCFEVCVFGYTHGMKGLRQLPFPAAHCSLVGVQKPFVCLSSKPKKLVSRLCHCLDVNYITAGKSYEARGWPGQST